MLILPYNPELIRHFEMIKEKLRNNVGQFLFQKTKRRPMILPVVIEV